MSRTALPRVIPLPCAMLRLPSLGNRLLYESPSSQHNLRRIALNDAVSLLPMLTPSADFASSF